MDGTFFRLAADPGERFTAARQAMMQAWIELLATGLTAEDVADEIESTRSAMAQLPALAVRHG